MAEEESEQQVQHLEINIPEWLANSNDQIVIICDDTGEDNGDPDGVVTVPLDAILDEADQNHGQVVQVQMPMKGSKPVPQTLYKSQGQVSQNAQHLSSSGQEGSVVTMSGDASAESTENVDETNRIQVVIREADDRDAASGSLETAAKVGQSSTGSSGDQVNVDKDPNSTRVRDSSPSKVTSNLNEHDYLAAKKPVQQQVSQVSRRSKRKAAMLPRRKRCHAGCCEGDEQHNMVAEKKAKSDQEEVGAEGDPQDKPASDVVSIIKKTDPVDEPAASNEGTNLELRTSGKKKEQAVLENNEQAEEEGNKPDDVDNGEVTFAVVLGTDGEGKISEVVDKTDMKAAMAPVVTRAVDDFTICPDGLEDVPPDSLPINIIKASKPKDVSSFSAELAVAVNTKFECVCGQTFTQKKSLIRHFRRKKARVDGLKEEGSEHYSKFPIAIYPNTKAPRKKAAPKSYTCPHCPKVLQTKPGMDYHIMNHTGFKPITCSLCGESFKSKQTLDQHFVIHSQTNELPHKCDECGRTYLTATRLKAHKKIHGDRQFSCDLCSHTFVMAKDLRKHMRVHTGEKPFECKFCEERFHFSQDVKRHLKRFHTDKAPFSCTQCPKPVYFFREEECVTHMKLHSQDSEFKCDVCLQNFPSYTTLRNHQIMHTNKKPFKCRYDTCGQEFKCANDRYLHERKVHDTTLLYCQFCRLSFKKASNFEEHQRKHTDATYGCRADPECELKFQQPHVRLRHEKSHKKGFIGENRRGGKKKIEGPPPPASVDTVYQCGICWKTYKNYPSLRDHVREHGDEYPYMCRVAGCDEKFKRVYHRRKHEQSHTTDEIINSVIDSRLRANEESIDLESSEEEIVVAKPVPVGGGGEQHLAPVADDTNEGGHVVQMEDETEIAVQFVLS